MYMYMYNQLTHHSFEVIVNVDRLYNNCNHASKGYNTLRVLYKIYNHGARGP